MDDKDPLMFKLLAIRDGGATLCVLGGGLCGYGSSHTLHDRPAHTGC